MKAVRLQLYKKETPTLVFSRNFWKILFPTILSTVPSKILHLIKAYPFDKRADFGQESINMKHICKAYCNFRNFAEILLHEISVNLLILNHDLLKENIKT